MPLRRTSRFRPAPLRPGGGPLALLLGVALLAAGSGCWSYANIPADGTDAALNSINVAPAPGILAESVRTVLVRHPLPRRDAPGSLTTTGTWRLTVPAPLSSGTRSTLRRTIRPLAPLPNPSALADDLPTYHIASMYIRATRSEVEVILPEEATPEDPRRRLVLDLRSTWSGWQVERVQRTWASPTWTPAPSAVYADLRESGTDRAVHGDEPTPTAAESPSRRTAAESARSSPPPAAEDMEPTPAQPRPEQRAAPAPRRRPAPPPAEPRTTEDSEGRSDPGTDTLVIDG